MNGYAHAFRWVVVLGVVQDWVFALPGVFRPNGVLRFVRTEEAAQPVWPAFSALLLLLLSTFYLPAARDPFRYRPVAILTVLARSGGVLFFLRLYRGKAPAWFGLIDLTFFLSQGTLLALAYRKGPRR